MLEALTLRAANLMTSSHAVYGVTHLGSLVRLLPERDPHENIFEMVEGALDDFDDARHAATHLARFELAMLAELGFGLDLSTCAARPRPVDLCRERRHRGPDLRVAEIRQRRFAQRR
jgi:DNA repair protein RecO (recombination protein O)